MKVGCYVTVDDGGNYVTFHGLNVRIKIKTITKAQLDSVSNRELKRGLNRTAVLFIFLSLLILRPMVFECLAKFKVAFTTLSTAVLHIGKREVFRRRSRITVNKVNLNALYKLNMPKKCFSRNEMYIPPMSDSSM